eukprot:gene39771-53778_t
MCVSLLRHEAIKTTVPKAKELRRVVEPLITLAKEATLSNRRLAFSRLRDRDVVTKLFNELGPRYQTRPGGYTRILKMGFRVGDNAPMAYVELVDRPDVAAEPVESYPSVAGWSSLVARWAHNPKVAGSNPAPATSIHETALPAIRSEGLFSCVPAVQAIWTQMPAASGTTCMLAESPSRTPDLLPTPTLPTIRAREAFAQTAPAAAPSTTSSLMSFLPLVLMFVVLYFIMIRPQMKRQKEHKAMIDALAKGDEVVIGGGILGRVSKMGETYVHVEVAGG